MPRSSILPTYLKKYTVSKDQSQYTAEEQATWRYIMRQARDFFKEHAVSIYENGLAKTGISIDHIPSIAGIDLKLSEFGWGAVGVEGFIPSSVFLDLLARKVLPIATDMRTLAHVSYTPAPDIVHEAAGHAPILADASYRKFLERYAAVAYRAILSADDIRLFEAIRFLSDVKENPDCSAETILTAEKQLRLAYSTTPGLSEAGKVARLAWWTIEYGLVGPLNNPKIYGAGLLSSTAESRGVYSGNKVKRIPLSLDCIHQGYDITEPQPQLFVAEDLDGLVDIVAELEDTFAFKRGGVYGLQIAQDARTINSFLFETGISVSGILTEFKMHGVEPCFLKLSGPSQICFLEKEISGQGITQHPHGFSSPIGRWAAYKDRPVSSLRIGDLEKLNIRIGHRTVLEFCSGIRVQGEVFDICWRENKLVMVSFKDCKVNLGETILFDPSWGCFDMIVGESVVSVFSGPADREAYGDYEVGRPTTKPGRTSKLSSEEKIRSDLFLQLRSIREKTKNHLSPKDILHLEAIAQDSTCHWLHAVEIAELFDLQQHPRPTWLTQKVNSFTVSLNERDKTLMHNGLGLSAIG